MPFIGQGIEDLRHGLPELPALRRGRLVAEHSLPPGDVAVIGADRELADLFEGAVAAGAPARQVANWIVGEVAPSGKLPSAHNLAELVKLVSDGSITRDQAREVLVESVETGRTPTELVAEHGHRQVSDVGELRLVAAAVIDANPKAVADYRNGKKQVINVLIRDLTTRLPQANRQVAGEVLTKLLD